MSAKGERSGMTEVMRASMTLGLSTLAIEIKSGRSTVRSANAETLRLSRVNEKARIINHAERLFARTTKGQSKRRLRKLKLMHRI